MDLKQTIRTKSLMKQAEAAKTYSDLSSVLIESTKLPRESWDRIQEVAARRTIESLTCLATSEEIALSIFGPQVILTKYEEDWEEFISDRVTR